EPPSAVDEVSPARPRVEKRPDLGGVSSSSENPAGSRTVSAENPAESRTLSAENPAGARTLSGPETPQQTPQETPQPNARAGTEAWNPGIRNDPPDPPARAGGNPLLVSETFLS